MHLDEKSVRRIIDEVWTLVVDARTEACGRDATADENVLVSSVDLSGAWEGTVAVRCSLLLGRLIAARTHRLQGVDPTDAQIRFALGEIVSLIGVSVGGLLSAPARISQAVVVDARGPAASRPDDAEAESTTCLSSLGHPFAVTVSLRARAA